MSVFLVFLSVVGCGQETAATCDPVPAIECAEILACCDLTSCWYEAGGREYPCASMYDCRDAAEGVIDDVCDF